LRVNLYFCFLGSSGLCSRSGPGRSSISLYTGTIEHKLTNGRSELVDEGIDLRLLLSQFSHVPIRVSGFIREGCISSLLIGPHLMSHWMTEGRAVTFLVFNRTRFLPYGLGRGRNRRSFVDLLACDAGSQWRFPVYRRCHGGSADAVSGQLSLM
jgi:hypothetical protein